MTLQDDTTVRQEALKAFANVQKIKERIERLERQMNERTDYDTESYMQLVERYTAEHERYLMLGPEGQEAAIERTLCGLGFLRTDFDRPTSEFSGGWRMRIELAKILLQHPDVLLLDEPTNHLDIESIQWLEQLLATWSGAVVLVSHDRAFINNVSNRTLEISCGHIVDYKVKYNEYVTLRRERREQQLRAYENQQKEMADMREFIERFRYKPTKAVQVQQKIRQLEKMAPIEVDEVDNSAMHLKFPPCLRSGDYPVICDEVGKSYGEHTVFTRVNITIKRGEKVAFVGKNGEGKSTLVKCIMGEIPFDGMLKIGHNVQIGYFAQNQAQLLDESLTVFQTIDNVARGDIRLRINDILGAFMFGGENSEKRVKVLSGGERSRLAMIRLLLEPVNLLILDEPTNHLDMPSKDVLKEAIRAFDGTAIIVSHDREFLDGLVTKVFEFGGGKVREHLGGIYDWIEQAHENQEAHPQPLPAGRGENTSIGNKGVQGNCSSPSQGGAGCGSVGAASYAQRKEQQKQLRKAERAVEESEKRIAAMEQRLKELDQLLCDPAKASDMTLVSEYTDTKRQLDNEVERWEQLSEELEALSAQ
jgi:ATP-binding cassette subfamily F protein 3